jgi:hypothetical protein
MDYETFIEENTLRVEASYRGGGIEIDVSELFGEGKKITAYQNYLGGGMLGSICSDINFIPEEKEEEKVQELQEELKKYFHNLTNHEDDEWESASYEENQSRPANYPGL